MNTSINDGPGCLMLRCPDPSCCAAVGQDMIDLLAVREDKEKYKRYFLRSFIEDNRKVITWKKILWNMTSYLASMTGNFPAIFAKLVGWIL